MAMKTNAKAAMNSTFDKSSVLNQTYDKNNDTSQLNSTYTKPVDQSTTQSYDITPARHELPPEPLEDEENYNIGDLKSDDDTDDEDAPKKVIPTWAQGMQFFCIMHVSQKDILRSLGD
jgi:inner centromere protein